MNYINLTITRSSFTWTFSPSYSYLTGFLWEIWWYNDLNFDLSILTSSGSAISNINVPDPYKTSTNISCTLACRSNYQSCKVDSTSCITDCSLNCFSGCYDFSNSKCIMDCPKYCFACEPNTDRCTSCISPYALRTSTNECICGFGYVQVQTTPPDFTCVKQVYYCNSYSTLGCTGCKFGYYLKCSPSCSCVYSCGAGYYPNLATMKCERCTVKNCNQCTSSTTCTRCDSTTFLKDSACVKTCGAGYYSNTIYRTCQKCSSNNCISCDYYLRCTVCAEGYSDKYLNLYGISDSNICSRCPDLCTSCLSNAECTSCVSNAEISSLLCICKQGYSNFSGNCVGTNEAYAVMNSDGSISLTFTAPLNSELVESDLNFGNQDETIPYDSIHFDITAQTFYSVYKITMDKLVLSGLNTLRLYFPPSGLPLENGVNLPQEYLDIYVTASSIQDKCSSITNCSTCSSINGVFECDSCKDSNCLYKSPDIRCGSCCENGYYLEDSLCEECPEKCLTCLSFDTCNSCATSYYLLGTSCEEDCGVGKYANNIGNICSNCISNCDECTNGSGCIECKNKYVIGSDGRSCVGCGESRYYENGECYPCMSLCIKCDSINDCDLCSDNADFIGGECRCKAGYLAANNNCERFTFNAIVSVNSNQRVVISFSKPLLNDLINTDIEFTNASGSYNFTMIKSTTTEEYYVTFDPSVFTSETNLTLTFKNHNQIYAEDQSVLDSSWIPFIICQSGQEFRYGACTGCPTLCQDCSVSSGCTTCTDGATQITSGICSCKQGFIQDKDTCIRTKFKASATMNMSRVITLRFEQELNSDLTSQDVTFTISNTSYQFIMQPITPKQSYSFILSYINYTGVTNITLTINNHETIYSVENSVLETSLISIPVCPDYCINCSGSTCNICQDNYYIEAGLCVSTCSTGFYANIDRMICNSCGIDKCASCILVDGDTRCEKCIQGEYLEGGECSKCPSLCKACTSFEICTECIPNAAIFSSICECNQDYKEENGTCRYFGVIHAYGSMDENGIISLRFDKQLEHPLPSAAITFTIGSTTLNSTFFTQSAYLTNQIYHFNLTSINFSGHSTITLSILNHQDIKSTDTSTLFESYIDITVHPMQKCPRFCIDCHLDNGVNICDGCEDGYVIVPDSPAYRCEVPCKKGCEICKDNVCFKCEVGYYLKEIECMKECGIGYYSNEERNMCEECDDKCEECEYENGELKCVRCEEGNVMKENGECGECERGKYAFEGMCYECPNLCKECSLEIGCVECVDHGRVVDGVCECGKGYVEEGMSCIKVEYSATAIYVGNGKIEITFSPSLDELDPGSVYIVINDVTYKSDSFILSRSLTSQGYILQLTAENLPIITSLKVQFDTQLMDYLLTESIPIPIDPQHQETSHNDSGSNLNINSDSDLDSSEESSQQSTPTSQADYLAQDPQAVEINSSTSTSSKAVTTISAAFSFSSAAGFWTFINTIQLLTLMPLLNVELPILLFATLSGLKSYSPIPNITEYFITQKGPSPNHRAVLLGYETSQFLLNASDMLSALVILIGIYPVIRLLIKVLSKKHSNSFIYNKLSSFISSYRWNIFLRFLIESYIELGVASAIQILASLSSYNFSDPNLDTNLILGSLTTILIVLSPILLAIFIYKNHICTHEEAFMRRWGSIFEEFRDSQGLYAAYYYYVYFMMRRLGLIICFFALYNYPRIQVITASTLCWLVRDILEVYICSLCQAF